MNTKTLEKAISFSIDEALDIYYSAEMTEDEREWFYDKVIDRLISAKDELPF